MCTAKLSSPFLPEGCHSVLRKGPNCTGPFFERGFHQESSIQRLKPFESLEKPSSRFFLANGFFDRLPFPKENGEVKARSPRCRNLRARLVAPPKYLISSCLSPPGFVLIQLTSIEFDQAGSLTSVSPHCNAWSRHGLWSLIPTVYCT